MRKQLLALIFVFTPALIFSQNLYSTFELTSCAYNESSAGYTNCSTDDYSAIIEIGSDNTYINIVVGSDPIEMYAVESHFVAGGTGNTNYSLISSEGSLYTMVMNPNTKECTFMLVEPFDGAESKSYKYN